MRRIDSTDRRYEQQLKLKLYVGWAISGAVVIGGLLCLLL